MYRYHVFFLIFLVLQIPPVIAFSQSYPSNTPGNLPFGILPSRSDTSAANGPAIYDSEVARMIADNMPLDSDILLALGMCYSGEWHENFNAIAGESSAAGANFDPYPFTNTTVVSAVTEGWGVQGGFGAAFFEDLKPGTEQTVLDVFNNNLSRAYSGPVGVPKEFQKDGHPQSVNITEVPRLTGNSSKPIGGENSTHVLIYAGIPDSHQILSEINNVISNFSGHPNTTIDVLAGLGDIPSINHPNVQRASKENLEATIKKIGGLMGPGEQFIFVGADHGSIHEIPPTQLVVPTGITGADIALDRPVLSAPSINLLIDSEFLDSFIPNDIELHFNGNNLGTLEDANFNDLHFGDNNHFGQFTLPINPNYYFTEGTESIEIQNNSDATLDFLVGFGSGPVPVMESECGAWCTDNALRHRYSFDTDFSDSIGNAHGIPFGDVHIVNGQADFPGFPDSIVSLPASGPNGININTYDEVTIEIWATPIGSAMGPFPGGDFTGTVLFGNQHPTNPAFSSEYLILTTHRGDDVSRASISLSTDNSPWTEESGANGPEHNDNHQHHYVAIVDANTIKLYVDGVLTGETPLDPSNVLSGVGTEEALLGAGYPQDFTWVGTIDEFRVYEASLTEEEVLNSFLAGPNSFPSFESTDFNIDGRVDELDLQVIEDTYATIVGPNNPGDSDGDGKVGNFEIFTWQRQHNSSSNSPFREIPEPTSGILILLACAMCFSLRPHR